MPFRPPKKPAQFSDLLAVLAQSKTQDDPMYQTIEIMLDRLVQFHGSTLEQLAITADKLNEVIRQVNRDIDNLDDFVDSINVVRPNRVLGRGFSSGPGPQEELIPGVYISIFEQVVPVTGEILKIIDVTGAGDTPFIVQNLDEARSRLPEGKAPGDYLPRAQETKLLASGYVTVTTGTGVLGSTATIPAGDIVGSIIPTLHASTHQVGGTDIVDIKLLGGYPGNTTTFLRGDGTFIILPPAVPGLHAPTHSLGGTDPVTITALAGYPGGTVNFLRADGTFSPPPTGGAPGLHASTHNVGQSDPVTVTTLAGYPGNTTTFLRGDGTFVIPPFTRNSALVNYTYNNSIVEPPASGQVRFNAAHPYTTVTKLWIRTVSSDGQDVYWGLMVISPGSVILVQDKDDHTKYVRFTTTALPIDKGLYVEISVTWKENSVSPLVNAQGVLLQSTAVTTQLHATAHQVGGGDVVDVKLLGGYPGGTISFLRADGTFATPPINGGIPALHHTTHEPGGADALANVAWTNLTNIFTGGVQTLNSADPTLVMIYSLAAANNRRWRVTTDGTGYHFQVQTDAGVSTNSPLILDRTGDATIGRNVFAGGGGQFTTGLGTTPLNASQLTSGTVPDARLSANVQMKPIPVADLPAHASNHASAGVDPISIVGLGGFPGTATTFLRGDRVFAVPNPAIPASHHTSHEPGGADLLVNSTWTNLSNTFTARQIISIPNAGSETTSSSLRLTAWSPSLELLDINGTANYHVGLDDMDDNAFVVGAGYGPGQNIVPFIRVRQSLGTTVEFPYGLLKFGAQNLSSDPSTLDAYLRGSWTPTLVSAGGGNSGQTYHYQLGRYIRIGSSIIAHFYISLATPGTFVAGIGLRINGIPINAGFPSVGAISFQGLAQPFSNVIGHVLSGRGDIDLEGVPAGGGTTVVPITGAAMATNTLLEGTIAYTISG